MNPLPLPGWADFYHHDGMYARKWPFPLCVYSVLPSKHRELSSENKGQVTVSSCSLPSEVPILRAIVYNYEHWGEHGVEVFNYETLCEIPDRYLQNATHTVLT